MKKYHGATLLDPSSEKVIRKSSMLVKDGHIQAVGTTENPTLYFTLVIFLFAEPVFTIDLSVSIRYTSP